MIDTKELDKNLDIFKSPNDISRIYYCKRGFLSIFPYFHAIAHRIQDDAIKVMDDGLMVNTVFVKKTIPFDDIKKIYEGKPFAQEVNIKFFATLSFTPFPIYSYTHNKWIGVNDENRVVFIVEYEENNEKNYIAFETLNYVVFKQLLLDHKLLIEKTLIDPVYPALYPILGRKNIWYFILNEVIVNFGISLVIYWFFSGYFAGTFFKVILDFILVCALIYYFVAICWYWYYLYRLEKA